MVRPKQPRSEPEQAADQTQTQNRSPDSPDMMQLLQATLEGHSKQFDKILQAIQDTKTTLETKIDTVALDLGILRADHRKLAERVTELESGSLTVQPTIHQLQKEVRDMAVDVGALQRRAEEAEGRTRRNNIRFVGFPEKAEAKNSDLFLEEWLGATVLGGNLPKFFSVERSHRTPGRPPPVGSPARPLIARFLNYRDRDLILQLFRTKGPFKFGNANISAYPDYTLEVQKKRATFMAVKKQLNSSNIKYALLFPAKLRVIADERVYFFLSPEDAWTWLHAKGLATRPSESPEEERWHLPKRRKKKNKSESLGPSEEQKLRERSQVLAAVTQQQFDENPYRVLSLEDRPPSESDSGGTTGSVASETHMPLLTPRSADDLG